MAIKTGMLQQVRGFFGDDEIDEDWLLRHISVVLDEGTKSVSIQIDNLNDQEFQWLKEET